jgi:probable addiction module antidote protein
MEVARNAKRRSNDMPLETHPFDPAAYLTTPEGVEAYLRAAFETDDPTEIADALGVVSRAAGMSKVAKDTGLTRPALFKAEAAASWTAYQETGRHLTGAEVRAWLRTWGESDGADLLACHD